MLYCQQFAYAPELNSACKGLLTCKERNLFYRYGFQNAKDQTVPTQKAYDEPAYDQGVHKHEDQHYDEQKNTSDMTYVHDSINDPYNTHGINLAITGGNVDVDPSVHPELAAAAYDGQHAIIAEGPTLDDCFLAPMDMIDPDSVELACDSTGCVLIKDDGDASNDVHVM